MTSLIFETDIAAPLEAVWAFHEDVIRSLPALSPPEGAVKIVSADLPVHVGSRIVISARILLGFRGQWVAKIVRHEPPCDGKAGFVDEQESGPFKAWRHEHRFIEVDSRTTKLVDEVMYRAPLGPLGWVADKLFLRRKVEAMFAYRHRMTRQHCTGGTPMPP